MKTKTKTKMRTKTNSMKKHIIQRLRPLNLNMPSKVVYIISWKDEDENKDEDEDENEQHEKAYHSTT